MKELLKRLPLTLNIQHFAEEGGEGDRGGAEQEAETINLTADELQKKIESESDRKLSSALEKKQVEWEALTEQRIQEAIEEKERLSKLSEKERKNEELSKREQEIADRLAEIERKELRSEAIDDLQKKNLPADFADFLLAEDAEKTLENINNFKKSFDDAVNEAVKEKMRQETPSAGGGNISKSQVTSVAELAEKHRLIK